MRKYEEYKDSGIDWIGSTPKSWTIKRVKNVFNQISLTGSELENKTYIPLENIESFTGRLLKRISNENNESTNLFKSGDILLNKLRPYLGKVYLPDFDGGVSGEVVVLRNNTYLKKQIFPKYFFYRFLSTKFIFKINSLTDGVKMPRTNPTKILRLEIPIPSLPEQQAIANYLDAKTQAIDKKVTLLEQKIETYKKLKRTLINQTITKGLRSLSEVEMKDSGIAWIGQIPQHWEVKRLKELGNIETSSINKKIEEDEDLIKLVNYTDVYSNLKREIWNNDDYMIVSANKLQISSKKLKQGDVLFTPSSETINDIGVSAVVMENLHNTLYSYHLLRLRFRKVIDLHFKKYLFSNDYVQYYFSKSATGTTRKILGLNTFNNLEVPLPPKSEQEEIATYLDQKTATIDAIVSNIGKQIETLKQLRKTLINDVVTGKIKVIE